MPRPAVQCSLRGFRARKADIYAARCVLFEKALRAHRYLREQITYPNFNLLARYDIFKDRPELSICSVCFNCGCSRQPRSPREIVSTDVFLDARANGGYHRGVDRSDRGLLRGAPGRAGRPNPAGLAASNMPEPANREPAADRKDHIG